MKRLVFMLMILLVSVSSGSAKEKKMNLFDLSNVFPSDKWTRSDTKYQLMVTTLTICDWMQTRYISKNPNDFHEKNIFLGEQPTTGKVDRYFISKILANYIFAKILDTKTRRIWQVGMIGYYIDVVKGNYEIGIKMDLM